AVADRRGAFGQPDDRARLVPASVKDAMTPELTRRSLLASAASLGVAGFLALVVPARLTRAWAQETPSAEQAAAFVGQTGARLVAIVNGPGSLAQKRAALQAEISAAVDVNGVGRFVLGRFWRVATPAQRQEYLHLFHSVLMNSITGRLGEYQGVRFSVGRATPTAGGVQVATVVTRPNNPPANVIWVIGDVGGGPKIIDVVAEGTSLRLTQRDDYASYLTRNNDSVQALIDALKRQVGQG
ncbi:MAG: MlaC/ttg2D family ABC transporter substrate-binding protein, partial [Acetobacteraceae bacterium]